MIRRLRSARRVSGLAAITSVMLPLYAARDAMAPPPDRDRVRDLWTRRWSASLLDLFGIERDVYDASGAPESAPSRWRRDDRGARRGRLVVANHRSAIDIGLVLEAFGGHVLSRADLASWPLVGAAARRVGTIFVDRGDSKSGASAIRAVADRLRNGATVCLFPEGTTFPDDEVRPFHPGAFIAAARAKADVLPVGIAYRTGSEATFFRETFLAHLTRIAESPGTRVALCVGAPIEGGTARDLAAKAHTAVSALVTNARARVDR